MGQGRRHVGLEVMGVVGDEEPDQELLQRGIVFGVAECGPGHVPEWLGQVELLDLLPGRGRDVEVDLIVRLGVGVEQGADDVEELGWSPMRPPMTIATMTGHLARSALE